MDGEPKEKQQCGCPSSQKVEDDNVIFDEAAQAIVKGDPDSLRKYLAEKPSLAVMKKQDGLSLLHIATSSVGTWDAENNLKAAQLLIQSGADVNARITNLGKTPLILASEYDAALCELLLRSGANPNTCTTTGHSALHFASGNGILIAVELILAYGGDVNLADRDGTSALHLAAYHGHYDVVKLLLEKGADPNKKDDLGTPLYHATTQNHPEVVELLRSVTRGEDDVAGA